MASTYSGGVGKLQLITDGEQSGTWGQITNANLQVIEEMVSGLNTHDVAGSATTTLSGDSNVGSSYSASESKVAIIKLTGAVTGAHDVVAPAEEGWYIVWDASSGDYDLTFKPSGGTGVVVPRGGKTMMFTDGSTMYNLLAEANSLTEINDADNNEIIKFAAIASAVNEITVTNNATGSGPTLSATGGDTNIDINITPKGTGEVNIAAGNLNYAGTAITSTGAELNYLDITTLGTQQASKAVTANASNIISSFESTGIDDNATSTAITIDSSENVSVDTGNLVIGTSGKGIDFSANGNAGGMTSELLDDYEEGTWTPVTSQGTPDSTSGCYTKIGRQVTLIFMINNCSDYTSGVDILITGLPFTVSDTLSGTSHEGHGALSYPVALTSAGILGCFVRTTNNGIYFSSHSSQEAVNYSEATAAWSIRGTVTYFTTA